MLKFITIPDEVKWWWRERTGKCPLIFMWKSNPVESLQWDLYISTALPVPHLHLIPICCINRHHSHISFSQLWYQAAKMWVKMWAAKLCRAHRRVFPPLLRGQQLSLFREERITAKCLRSWGRQQLGQQFRTWCENFQISRSTQKFYPE